MEDEGTENWLQPNNLGGRGRGGGGNNLRGKILLDHLIVEIDPKKSEDPFCSSFFREKNSGMHQRVGQFDRPTCKSVFYKFTIVAITTKQLVKIGPKKACWILKGRADQDLNQTS